MRIFQEVLEHPVQASRVRLNVFEDTDGYLVTEARIGTVTVVATLGLFGTRDQALARAQKRIHELEAQLYRTVTKAA